MPRKWCLSASSPTLSDILKLDPVEEPWCLGTTKKNQRCQLPTNAPGRRTAIHLLNDGTKDLRAGRCIDSLLEDLAPYLLCSKYHLDQASELAERWQRRVDGFVDAHAIPVVSRETTRIGRTGGGTGTGTGTGTARRSSRTGNPVVEVDLHEEKYERLIDAMDKLRALRAASLDDDADIPRTRSGHVARHVRWGNINNNEDDPSQGRRGYIPPHLRRGNINNNENANPSQTRSGYVPPHIRGSRGNDDTTTTSQGQSYTPPHLRSRNSNNTVTATTFTSTSTTTPISTRTRTSTTTTTTTTTKITATSSSRFSRNPESRMARMQPVQPAVQSTSVSPQPSSIHAVCLPVRQPVKGECGICLCALKGSSGYDDPAEGDQELVSLVWCKARCGVNYHKRCMGEWLKTSVSATCPTCRSPWRR